MSAGRILHCIPSMGGGGAERQLSYLAAELCRIGWEVHVALTGRGPNWERLERSGAVIHEVPAFGSYDVRVVRHLHRIITDVKPDLVQVWLRQMELYGGMAASTSRRPLIFSERASADAYPPGFKSMVRRRMAALATAIIANSEAGDDYWARQLPQSRRYVIPNGVSVEEIAATAPAAAGDPEIYPELPLILFAGRFDPQKNIDTLLAAMKLVLARRAAQVLFCGEGPLRGRIDEWLTTEGLVGRVRVSGYSPRLWAFMKRASVFVSPSLFEGNPNVVLEAMAGGVPLVVSDIREHRELLDERSALLVNPRSAKDLAAAVETVLDDPAAASTRAVAAVRRLQGLSLPAVAARYHDVYLEALSEVKKR